MTKKKILIIAVAAVIVIAGILALIFLQMKPKEPPIEPVDVSSQESSSNVSSEFVVPDIVPPDPIVTSQVSSSEATITVKGDVGDNTSSVPPTSSKPKNDKNEGVASKPQKPTSSTPPADDEFRADGTKGDPNSPVEGTIKIEDGYYWSYSNGKWWDGGSVEENGKVVDDSNLKVYCPFCNLEPKDCDCPPVGY